MNETSEAFADTANQVVNLVEGKFDKVGKEVEHRLKVVKLSIQAHMHLVDEHGEVVAETSAQPITMFPAKFSKLQELVAKIEEEANKKTEDKKILANQVMF